MKAGHNFGSVAGGLRIIWIYNGNGSETEHKYFQNYEEIDYFSQIVSRRKSLIQFFEICDWCEVLGSHTSQNNLC